MYPPLQSPEKFIERYGDRKERIDRDERVLFLKDPKTGILSKIIFFDIEGYQRKVYQFDRTGDLILKSWLIPNNDNTSSKYHRLNGPAIIRWWGNGKTQELTYMENGIITRSDDMPSITEFDRDGSLLYQHWIVNGSYFRENDMPSHIEYNSKGSIIGKRWKRGYQLSWSLHRDCGPASIEYYDDGNPASIEWCFDGKRHRDDGPAVIQYNKNGSFWKVLYFLNDINVTEYVKKYITIDRTIFDVDIMVYTKMFMYNIRDELVENGMLRECDIIQPHGWGKCSKN